MKTIETNSTITATLMTDSKATLTAKVLERKGDYVILSLDGKIIRKKIAIDSEGNECVYAMGKYSMCPVFQ